VKGLITDNMFGVRDPIPSGLRSRVCKSLNVRAVMPVVSAKQSGIFPYVCKST